MGAFVEGIGIVGGFGAGVDEFSEALSAGRSPVQAVSYKTADGTADMPAFIADTIRLDDFVPKKSLRRIDHYSKMALLGAHCALEDAGMLDKDLSRLGIVVASGYGASATTFAFLDSFIVTTDTYSSPTFFSNSVHNAATAHISILLGTKGPCLTVSQFEASVPSALTTALLWLEEGRAEQVLFGSVDEYCDVLGYSWRKYFGLNEPGKIVEPFLFDKQSAIIGEGAAFFLLSRKEEPAKKRYGRISVNAARYGGIEYIPEIERNRFIIGADGNMACGRQYEQHLSKAVSISSFTPLFGTFPTNTSFDMASGLLAKALGRMFPPPEGVSVPEGLNVDMGNAVLEENAIYCLKLGNRGEVGIITVGGP